MKKWGLFLILVSFSLRAEEKVPDFWSTGPLIAPPDDVIDLGHLSYQPYLYWTQYRGGYDAFWKFQKTPLFTTVSAEPLIRIGCFPRGEFDFTPTVSFNRTRHASNWVLGDIPVSLDTSLIEEDLDEGSLFRIKLRLSANLPVGKYKKLKTAKLETDSGGTGCWFPGIGLIFYQGIHFYKSHYFSMESFITYQYGTPVHVKGVNVYGGDKTTRGKIRPGGNTQVMISLQYSLAHRWVLALDGVYIHKNRSRFKGDTTLPMTSPSSEQFSLAPALEYMWSENFGIIGGAWLTVGGRNSDQFTSGVISIYINK